MTTPSCAPWAGPRSTRGPMIPDRAPIPAAFVLFALILLSLGASSFSLVAAANDPEAAVKAYFGALARKDRAQAIQLTAHFPNLGDVEVAAATERSIQAVQRPGPASVTRGSKALGDCAVVILLESPTDP